eukprot:TRINITY_DN7190_c0_g1_i2.p1 TRINITY_DN7190_c0_g1~~TRINITY_DN7190_c0_g1_i2.p1  ORF type:complete len:1104 (+),score=203.09 TRINITY_DN7190_c0_g1_i2:85-3396(+)
MEEDPSLFKDVAQFAQELGFGSTSTKTSKGSKEKKSKKKDVSFDPVKPKEKQKNKLNKKTEVIKKSNEKVGNRRNFKQTQETDNSLQNGKQEKSFSVKSNNRNQHKDNFQRGGNKFAKQELVKNYSYKSQSAQISYENELKVKAKSILSRNEPANWHVALQEFLEQQQSQEKQDNDKKEEPIDENTLQQLRQMGEHLQKQENAAFQRLMHQQKLKDMKWLSYVKTGGTTTDRIAAATLLIQESAVANIDSIDLLLSWVEKRKGGGTAIAQAMDALTELFMLNLIPPHRKLKFLSQQQDLYTVKFLLLGDKNLEGSKEAKKKLLYWYIEETVKRKYHAFVSALELLSKDNLEFLRGKALRCTSKLLSSRAEQEGRLLKVVVNKLGDIERKIASNAGYLLTTLLHQHPAMKTVVAREVERYLFRPGLKTKAQYYAILFLNNIILSNNQDDRQLAKKLVDLFFMLFRLILSGKMGHAAKLQQEQDSKVENNKHNLKNKQRKKKRKPSVNKNEAEGKPKAEEMDARMLSAIITGVRRAFPYVDPEEVESLVDRHANDLFHLVHVAPFTVGVQALMLLFQLMASKTSVNDRFYRTLYACILSTGFLSASLSKPSMFLSLVFKAMKQDISLARISAFTKRLLQVSIVGPSHFACGTLLILSEVLKVQPGLWTAIRQSEDHDEDEKFEDVTSDTDTEVKSKQIIGNGIVNSSQRVKSEVDSDFENEQTAGKDFQINLDFVEQQRTTKKLRFGTVDQKDDAEYSRKNIKKKQKASFENKQLCINREVQQQYDMKKREPLYCGAQTACWWELCVLAAHSHPTVSVWARTIIQGEVIHYEGDPLVDYTLSAYLDKFAHKKAKPLKKSKHRFHEAFRQTPGLQSSEGEAAALALKEAGAEGPEDVLFGKYYELKRNNPFKNKRALKKQKMKLDQEDTDDELDLLEQEEEQMGMSDEDAEFDLDEADGDLSDDVESDASDFDQPKNKKQLIQDEDDQEDDGDDIDSLLGDENQDDLRDFDFDENSDEEQLSDADFEMVGPDLINKNESVSEDDINVFDLPSPGVSEEDTKKRKKSSVNEQFEVRQQKKKKKKVKKDVFAPAEEYEELMKQYSIRK